MRRVFVLAVVALAAVVLYATAAPAGQQAVTPKQFTALSKRVKTLENITKDLETIAVAVITCVFDKGAVATTKAPQYHAPGVGEATDFYVLTTNNQDCVNLINSPIVRGLMERAR
jgi:hypothetical protein